MRLNSILILLLVFVLAASFVVAQETPTAPISQELSDVEGIPVLIKHLPDWEKKRDQVKFFSNRDAFQEYFADRKIVHAIDFIDGTEAVYADYEEGKLLIVEYTTPQASTAFDKDILALAGKTDDRYLYKRIGNYNVFLFEPTDKVAGNALMDQIEYSKVVLWPNGDSPNAAFRKERSFIVGTKSLFVSTVWFILTGVAGAIVLGFVAGVTYFKIAERNRIALNAFSDAGGLTRLNLDGLSVDLPIKD